MSVERDFANLGALFVNDCKTAASVAYIDFALFLIPSHVVGVVSQLRSPHRLV